MLNYQVLVNLGGLIDGIEADAAPIIKEVTFGIETEMKLSMAEPKTGNVYVRKGRVHRASAKGEAPAVDYGFLLNSIKADMRSPLQGVVSIGAEYGYILDQLKDRPFVEPAIEKTLERVS